MGMPLKDLPQRVQAIAARAQTETTGASAVVVTLPLPPRELHPNARPHFMARARAVRRYRERAHLEALSVRPARPWKAATVECIFYHRDNRRRDRDNLLASLKAAFDGLADGGIVENDAGLTHLPVVLEVDRANPRVVLVIRRTNEAGQREAARDA